MSETELSIDQLKFLVSKLPAEVRFALLSEIERGELSGKKLDLVTALLASDKERLKDRNAPSIRRLHLSRAFFEPCEPFLVSEETETKITGRICRASLMTIWTWISRDVAPSQTAAAQVSFNDAFAEDDREGMQKAVSSYQETVLQIILEMAKEWGRDEFYRRRIISDLRGERVFGDLLDVVTLFRARDALAVVEAGLPSQIKRFNEDNTENIRSLLEAPELRQSAAFAFGVGLLYKRLVNPAMMINFVTRIEKTDDPAKLMNSTFARGAELLIDDLDRCVIKVAKAAIDRKFESASGPLREFREIVRALRTAMDLSGDSKWVRQIAKLRSEMAKNLTVELDSLPGRIRRLLRIQSMDEGAQEIDHIEVTEVEELIDLLSVCRDCAEEIALNEITSRVKNDIQNFLDTQSGLLMDNVRIAKDATLEFRIMQIGVCIRFCEKVFGPAHAQLIQKSLEVALSSDRVKRSA